MSSWALSEQLAMYRTIDAFDRAQFNKEIAVDNALLRREAEALIIRYNELVARANDLHRHATEVANDSARKDSVIAELEHAKAVLEAECERLRQKNHEQELKIRLLRDVVRQDHPDIYPPD
jgi:peptidoglycan hydrolase CwlO-like protein